jgi:hypothetical protein
MNLLLVTFALRNKHRDYEQFFVELRGNSVNWWHFIGQTAVVSSHLDADSFAKKLIQQIETTDSLLVVKVEPHQFQGWLPPQAWDWLNSVSESIKPTLPSPLSYLLPPKK